MLSAKEPDALSLGVEGLLVTTDEAQVAAARRRLDFVLNTISGNHKLLPMIGMLDLDGTVRP